MFHPLDQPLERGWVGRIDGDRVVQLAAQTLQSLFTGGGTAREHAEYPLAGVRLLAPVLHPPAVRIFEDQTTFAFANPASLVGPGGEIVRAESACNSLLQSRLRRPGAEIDRDEGACNSLLQGSLTVLPRLAAMVGAEGALAGFTVFADWRDPAHAAPKDRDFALGLGPVVVTADELDPAGLEVIVRVDESERARATFDELDWRAARDLAAEGTRLIPGDLLVSPAIAAVDEIGPGSFVELEVPGIGVLEQVVSG